MNSLMTLLLFRILALLGATANTIGFLTFFFWDGLAEYRWLLIGGGIALLLVAELGARWAGKRSASNT